MLSLADFLRSLLNPPAPDATGPGWTVTPQTPGSTTAYPRGANIPSLPEPAVPSVQSAGDPLTEFEVDPAPALQFGAPGLTAVMSPWDAALESPSGGILGNFPVLAGGRADISRPIGILKNFGNPEPRTAYGAGTSLIDAHNPLSIGVPPIATVPVGFVDSLRIPTLPLGFSRAAPSVGFSPQPSSTQSSWASERVAPQTSDGVTIPAGPERLPLTNGSSSEFLDRSHFVPPEQGSPENQRDNIHVYARIYHPETSDWPGTAIDGLQGQRSESFDTGEQNDWSAYLRRAQIILPSAVTGNPYIDGTTRTLIDTLAETGKVMGQFVPPGTLPNVFGIAVHVDFGRRVRNLDLSGIGRTGVEHSLSRDDYNEYGAAGTVRTDVLLLDRFRRPVAIYDVKTGNARLTARRIQELRNAAGAGDIPVIELRLIDLTALHR